MHSQFYYESKSLQNLKLRNFCSFTIVIAMLQSQKFSFFRAFDSHYKFPMHSVNFKKTGFFVLLLCYFSSSAQVMNVRKWRPSERDSLNKGMELFDEKFFLQALPTFEALLKNHPNEEFLQYTYAKCALYRPDKHADAYKYLSEVYEKNKKTPDIQYDMALACHYNYKFDEALDYANQNLKRTNAEGKKNTDVLIRYINNAKYYYAKPTQAKIVNLGSGINTVDEEYVPAITADESKLIYTYAGTKSMGGRQADGNYLEDIYMSVKENGEFKNGVPVDSLNTYSPDAAISLSNDGSALFVYRDIGDSHGDLYMSQLNGANFSRPAKLKGEVNSYSWDG
ncbi:MAG: tetratricopeptide repeat protein, partial [Bacteroidia bacterium]|nr:tetratricopeptide repeat protein [Bacteroidia bacterium]